MIRLGRFRASLIVAVLTAVPGVTLAKTVVVASTEDLAALAREVGGGAVDVESIARGNQDPHFVELLPSYMVRVSRADLYLKVGMDLDYWAQSVIDGSRNARLTVLDCSTAVPLDRRLEVPDRVDPSMGDVHKFGNPHYWLDPENGRLVARSIAGALSKIDAAGAAGYRSRLAAFEARLDARLESWRKAAAGLSGLPILTYHNSWPYFCRAFGIVVSGWLEPKPGVKPSPSHVAKLVGQVKSEGIALIAYEPYFESRTPQLIGRQTGVPVVVLAPSVGGVPEVTDYLGLFDYNLKILGTAVGR